MNWSQSLNSSQRWRSPPPWAADVSDPGHHSTIDTSQQQRPTADTSSLILRILLFLSLLNTLFLLLLLRLSVPLSSSGGGGGVDSGGGGGGISRRLVAIVVAEANALEVVVLLILPFPSASSSCSYTSSSTSYPRFRSFSLLLRHLHFLLSLLHAYTNTWYNNYASRRYRVSSLREQLWLDCSIQERGSLLVETCLSIPPRATYPLSNSWQIVGINNTRRLISIRLKTGRRRKPVSLLSQKLF